MLGLGNNLISGQALAETEFNTQSLILDGTGDYVNFGDLDIVGGANGEGPYSVSAWFKTSTEDTNMHIVGKGDTPRWTMEIKGDDNKLDFEHMIDASNKVSATSGSTLTDGNWHHCLVTADRSGSLIMYIDGSAQGSPPSLNTVGLKADINQSSKNLVVGTYSKTSSSKFWNGNIDEVAIWDAVLSADDATSIYNSGKPNDLTDSASYDTDRTSSLVAYWRFEGDYTDSSTNSNSGSAVADATFSTSVP
tara:strand:+ start:39 stop:785 length:747 start_codon:yes stop_codon:yes gene_type:complete